MVKTTKLVERYVIVSLLLFFSSPAILAMDISIMSGFSFNGDMELTPRQFWPASVSPSAEPGDSIEVRNQNVTALAVDFLYNNQPDLRVGLYLSHQATVFGRESALQNRDMDISHVHVTSMKYYPDGDWERFILAGGGMGFFNPEDNSLHDVSRLSIQIGAGANYRLSNRLMLRIEARWFGTVFKSSSRIFCNGNECTVGIASDIYDQIQIDAGLLFRF